jgi:hypothetical protein
MSDRYPAVVRKQNDILRAELGENPRYAWRWSEDLMHVLEVLDSDGAPLYVEAKGPYGIVCMVPKTATKKLLPQHHDQWVVCALVEVNAKDGSIHGTGSAAWIPVSGPSGVVCLPENEPPTIVFTQSIIDALRLERSKSATEFGAEWEERERKREKDRWNRIYDEIRGEATAFFNIPGMKAHVSFPTPGNQVN